jgi:FkbM family methyltransferase
MIAGMNMRIDLRDEGVGHIMYDSRDYEPVETRFVTQTLKPGGVFLDIGANIGFYSVQASRVAGPEGRVVAIEPDSYNFGLLKQNIRANQVGAPITPLNIALGEDPGVAYLHKNPLNFGDHRMYGKVADARHTTEVTVKPLDMVVRDLALPQVDLIKMDVQGFEFHVLRA